jgi:hypothetical protein
VPQCKLRQAGDLTVTATYQNGAGIIVKPLMAEQLRLDRFKGSTNPIQGWVSFDYAVKVPAEAIRYSKQVKAGTTFATLLLPFKNKAADYSVAMPGDTTFKIGFNGDQYLIVFSDGSEQRFGDFEFDGQMLCAKYDAEDKLIACCGAKTSRILYQGEVLLDSVIRQKIDSENCI